MCQFHQHFTRGFFVQKFCTKLFCTYILGLNFFWPKNIGANAGEIDHMFLLSAKKRKRISDYLQIFDGFFSPTAKRRIGIGAASMLLSPCQKIHRHDSQNSRSSTPPPFTHNPLLSVPLTHTHTLFLTHSL
jgi:hypothetical protein